MTRNCCVGLARHLRQVGDAQHLRALAERPQLPADDLGDRAADAAVHLVEHHAHGRRPAAAATCTARLMRDSSPPEATLARLFGG